MIKEVEHQEDDSTSNSKKQSTDESKTNKEQSTDDSISVQGLKAGPRQTPKNDSERKSTTSRNKLPDTKEYNDAPYIDRSEFNIQDGDFIRYVKEDNIVYQGTVLRGQPVEHGFNYYAGQDNDFVVQLEFEKGKHVAMQEIQQEDKITVMMSKERTAYGRNIETVSPEEIIAVSPDYEYDWYKFKDAWDIDNNEYQINLED